MSKVNTATFFPFPARNASGKIASQSITVSTSAIGVTTAYADTVDVVTFDVQTSAVRARWDGTDPTSTVGHYLAANTSYTWSRTQFNDAKFIRDTSASVDATIFCSPGQV